MFKYKHFFQNFLHSYCYPNINLFRCIDYMQFFFLIKIYSRTSLEKKGFNK